MVDLGNVQKCHRSTAKASPREVRDRKGKEHRGIGCDDRG